MRRNQIQTQNQQNGNGWKQVQGQRFNRKENTKKSFESRAPPRHFTVGSSSVSQLWKQLSFALRKALIERYQEIREQVPELPEETTFSVTDIGEYNDDYFSLLCEINAVFRSLINDFVDIATPLKDKKMANSGKILGLTNQRQDDGSTKIFSAYLGKPFNNEGFYNFVAKVNGMNVADVKTRESLDIPLQTINEGNFELIIEEIIFRFDQLISMITNTSGRFPECAEGLKFAADLEAMNETYQEELDRYRKFFSDQPEESGDQEVEDTQQDDVESDDEPEN